MTTLDRSALLAQATREHTPTDEVPVPEFGDGATVRIRIIGSAARLKWVIARDTAILQASAPAQAGEERAELVDPTGLLISLAAVDDDLNPILSINDVATLAEIRGDVTERIANRIIKFNGMGDQAARDAEGKSGTSPNGDSPSDSAETSGSSTPTSSTEPA